MEFQDRILSCVDCGAEFVWTAGEQQFFADKNFKNEPKRCKACKGKRASRPAGARSARERVETVTQCSACGKETTVPFQADAGAPGVLQGMLPVPEIRRGWRRLAFHRSLSCHSRPSASRSRRAARRPPSRAGCVKLTARISSGAFSMQIEERDVGDVVVLDLKGKITLGEGDELLKDKVNSLVNQGHKKIVLNLADVPYIDSAGPRRNRPHLHDRQPAGRQPQAAEPDQAHHRSAVDHEAADRVRDVRLGERRGPEFFGIGQGLVRHPR